MGHVRNRHPRPSSRSRSQEGVGSTKDRERDLRAVPGGGSRDLVGQLGAPRFAGGYHPHHGQDILCRYGAPVLAVEGGIVRFGADPLGGREAFLERKDGSYWYYAHLKSYATGLASGDRVKTGRIIGRCGASGDATVPHVHFALFTAEHVAVDPMRALISWLRAAQKSLPACGITRSVVRSPPLILPTPREPVNLAGAALYAEGSVGSAGAESISPRQTGHGRGRA